MGWGEAVCEGADPVTADGRRSILSFGPAHLLLVALCGCTLSGPKYELSGPGPDLNPPLSQTTGDYEEGWFLGYFDLTYYGFNQAAVLYTHEMISTVDACPSFGFARCQRLCRTCYVSAGLMLASTSMGRKIRMAW
jgi:hypothetical protein